MVYNFSAFPKHPLLSRKPPTSSCTCRMTRPRRRLFQCAPGKDPSLSLCNCLRDLHPGRGREAVLARSYEPFPFFRQGVASLTCQVFSLLLSLLPPEAPGSNAGLHPQLYEIVRRQAAPSSLERHCCAPGGKLRRLLREQWISEC